MDMVRYSGPVKDLLEQAAGPKGRGDSSWHAAGIERLYFQHPSDVKCAGLVEVRRDEDNTSYVRMEIHLPPEIAAKVIAMVTGADAGAGDAPWVAERDTVLEVAVEPTPEPSPAELALLADAERTAAETERADRQRMAALTDMIRAESAVTSSAADDEEKDESDPEVPELNFD